MQGLGCSHNFIGPQEIGSFTGPQEIGSFTGPQEIGSFTGPQEIGSFTGPQEIGLSFTGPKSSLQSIIFTYQCAQWSEIQQYI